MKLVTYRTDSDYRLAAQVDSAIIDLQKAYEEKLISNGDEKAKEKAAIIVPSESNDFFKGGEDAICAAKEAVAYALERQDTSAAVFNRKDVEIGAPVIKPNKIICVGHNYREHILEMKRDIPEYPVLFAKFSNTVSGPEDTIPLPSITEKLDYEAEFTVVIGKTAKDVPLDEALDYVAGYTIVNDVTFRDLQKRTLQWLQGKSPDGSAPMGPWLVTKDEIPDPTGLEIFLTVNGEERQRSNTSNLVFSVPRLIEYISSIMTLEPGDVILTGTPGGVGVAMDPPTFLKDGDVVSITVDKVGTLENTVKKIDKEKVKEYATKINNNINRIVSIAKEQPEEVIQWKPSEEEWSIAQILNHVEEANRFWLQELKRIGANPEIKWGRGLDHKERLAAVSSNHYDTELILNRIYSFKTTIRQTLVNLNDHDLLVEATHKNPKFGTKPLSFLVDHFMVEHLEKHVSQIERNLKNYQS
jgi:2-keto-4-pentenoate hydratase/2-oxohepta-3-ene-1,7-dioic acid hydratase in catechol pathway